MTGPYDHNPLAHKIQLLLYDNKTLIEQGDKTPPRRVEEEEIPTLSTKGESQSIITSVKPTEKRSRWDSKTHLEL